MEMSRFFKTVGSIYFCYCFTAVYACTCQQAANRRGELTMPERTIGDVLNEHTKDILSIPGVVGTAEGLCDKKPCITVFVIKKTRQLNNKIPPAIEGYQVILEETGKVRILPDNLY